MDGRLVLRLIVTLVLGALTAWLVALFIGLASQSVTAVIVLRTVLGVAILAMLTRIVMRRAYDDASLLPRLAVAAVLSYALFPPTWNGRALLGQLLLDPGWATALLDLVVWVGVVVLAGLTVPKAVSPAERRPYQLA